MENKIKYYRELKKITQEELSELSGVSRVVICNLENGNCNSTKTTTMKKISEALNVSIYELFYT